MAYLTRLFIILRMHGTRAYINNNTLSEIQSIYTQYPSSYKGSRLNITTSVSPSATTSSSISNIVIIIRHVAARLKKRKENMYNKEKRKKRNYGARQCIVVGLERDL